MRKPAAVSVAEAGRRGGKARAAKLTAEERSESARYAIKARWDKVKNGTPAALPKVAKPATIRRTK